MQPSALWRQSVVLPLDYEAMHQIIQGNVSAHSQVNVLPIDDFDLLWQCGLFQKLNLACGTAIGDYESAWIETDQLTRALRVVTEFPREGHSADVKEFLFSLSRLIVRAQEVAMPIYFEC